MWFAASVMITLGYDLAPLDNQGADHGIRVGAPPPFSGKFQDPREKPLLLLVVQSHGFNRLAQG